MRKHMNLIITICIGVPLIILLWYLTKPKVKGVVFKMDTNATSNYAEGLRQGVELSGLFSHVDLFQNEDGTYYVKARYK